MGDPGDGVLIPISYLQETAGELNALMYEFDHAKDTVDEFGPEVGNGDVRDALHDFEDNWKTHREELLNKMKSVYDLATDTAQAFIDQDDELVKDIASSVHQEHKGGKVPE